MMQRLHKSHAERSWSLRRLTRGRNNKTRTMHLRLRPGAKTPTARSRGRTPHQDASRTIHTRRKARAPTEKGLATAADRRPGSRRRSSKGRSRRRRFTLPRRTRSRRTRSIPTTSRTAWIPTPTGANIRRSPSFRTSCRRGRNRTSPPKGLATARRFARRPTADGRAPRPRAGFPAWACSSRRRPSCSSITRRRRRRRAADTRIAGRRCNTARSKLRPRTAWDSLPTTGACCNGSTARASTNPIK
mmetsp:Transcript_24172/g.51798  ORF Transcript_24172/g.51798 Transcript_24172/m.51798 type:complete len:245 (-) Transcript_24172:273-1007(-)